MGTTCSCQQRVDLDEFSDDPYTEDKNKKPNQDDHQQEKNQDDQQDQQKVEQQTVDIDPIQLQSYEWEDNQPEGLIPLSALDEKELFSQFPAAVKKQLQKLPKLKIQKTALSPNYLRIPSIEVPYQLPSGDVYVGQWADRKPFGLGKIYYADYQVYEGQVVDGIPDGQGRKIFKDGSYYAGIFKMGEITGRGKFIKSKNGFTYEGDFLSGRPHGQGNETWPDGTAYQGQYQLGKKFGRGTFTWGSKKRNDGREENYVGEFKDDVFHGQGRYEWQDGRIYDGDWVEGKMEGKGVFIWPDNKKYEGGYLKDFKSGYGVLEWPDGKKLAGNWSLGKLYGIATLTIKGKLKEGQTEPEKDKEYQCEWEDGKRIRWIDNNQPSLIQSNISFQRNFDEHQQQNTSQILPSQIRSNDPQQNQMTIFQQQGQQEKKIIQQNNKDSDQQQQQIQQNKPNQQISLFVQPTNTETQQQNQSSDINQFEQSKQENKDNLII